MKHLYIEPTSHCNLHCEMCSRNHWKNESIGHMELSTFTETIKDLPATVERIFFGGIGEPLTHPHILEMIEQAKSTGRKVEMITNGILLTPDISKALVKLGLNTLWISLDTLERNPSSSIGHTGDVNVVLSNMRTYNEVRGQFGVVLEEYTDDSVPKSKLGIAFVLTKKNLNQFYALAERSHQYGIDIIKATHLIPYDEESEKQVCYRKMFDTDIFQEQTELTPHIDLPLLDPRDISSKEFSSILSNPNITLSILSEPLIRKRKHCRFIHEDYVFVRWDGTVCPCMALLHDNQVYQLGRIRSIRHSGYGNVAENSLNDIWNSESYKGFRERVATFTFSPCITCGACELFSNNKTDCLGNPFPTCGGCLWAEGLFQCP